MKFRIVEIEPDTPAWHRWRQDGVGGSDASVIMGWNRYKTVEQLVAEKLGLFEVGASGPLAQRGKALESLARQEYQKVFNVRLSIPTCVQHNEIEWLRASLDGANFIEDYAVEIKCGASNYRSHLYTRSTVPWVYDQLQHILAVTGFEHSYLWCWQPGHKGIRRKIRRNEAYIRKLINAERRFWKEVELQKKRC